MLYNEIIPRFGSLNINDLRPQVLTTLRSPKFKANGFASAKNIQKTWCSRQARSFAESEACGEISFYHKILSHRASKRAGDVPFCVVAVLPLYQQHRPKFISECSVINLRKNWLEANTCHASGLDKIWFFVVTKWKTN